MADVYVCSCGKQFNSPASFNGHKRHCRFHLGEEHYNRLKQIDQKNVTIATERASLAATLKKKKKLELWEASQHFCEYCGKPLIRPNTRFCSRECANTRKHSEETKYKIGSAFRKQQISFAEYLDRKAKEPMRVIYSGPVLPKIILEGLPSGWPSSTRRTYAEKFWKSVLDNNLISYEEQFPIDTPKGVPGKYRLDFLVDGKFDIEVDGHWHKEEEAIERDIRRTIYLESLGYIVYRIPWINPVGAKNKAIVNEQIEELFKFLHKERIR